jgi:hypothetical protein
MKKLRLRLRVTIGIGVIGSSVTTLMETRYAAEAFRHHLSGSQSILDGILRLTEDDFVFAGAVYFILAVIATWIPWMILTIEWCVYRYDDTRGLLYWVRQIASSTWKVVTQAVVLRLGGSRVPSDAKEIGAVAD